MKVKEFLFVLLFLGTILGAYILGKRQERIDIRERALIDYKYCYTNQDLEVIIFGGCQE